MKKNYSFKKLILSIAIIPSLSFSQTLEDVKCNINLLYTDVTNLVPNMYVFDYDGGSNYIDDGGGDMYDMGNYLNTDLGTEIDYSDDVILASSAFGPTGQYFTRQLPGFFMLAADLDGVTTFSISGENGADGSGDVTELVFSTTYAGVSYDVFIKQISAAFDPSIVHFIIIPSNGSASHSYATDTDNDQHDLDGISNTTRLYYFLVSSDPDDVILDADLMNIADEFLSAINGHATLQANATDTDICAGEMVTLTGSGATTYTWSGGIADGVEFTPAVGMNTYTVSSTATNGCGISAQVTVVVNEIPDFTLTTSDALFSNDGSVFLTLNGGIFPFAYDWDNDGTGDFDDQQNLVNVTAGTYTVVVEHGNGCQASATATVNSQVGIEELQNEKVSVYPNPTTHSFTLKFEGAFNYQVVNAAGQVVMTGSAVDSEEISLENSNSGVYFVTVSNEDETNTIQIIKK